MTADIEVASPTPLGHSPGTVIARYSAKRALRPAALWGVGFGVVVASAALSYGRTYKTVAERQRLAATFGSDHAASALFGPAPELQTVAGFTVYKVSMTLTIVGALWGLLLATRLLRGDEDAGRTELLVIGQTTRRRAVAQVLAGLGVGSAVLWAITSLVTVVVGRSSSVHIGAGAGLYLALSLVAGAVMFLCVGAVASQLAPSRRQAAGYAAAFLGLSYGVRMVADAGTGLHWLAWVSPLGWVEQLQPLTDPRPWALLPIGAFTAALCLLAVCLAGRRDVGVSTWPDRTASAPHMGLLAGPTGLALRLTRLSLASWTAAVAMAGLLMGVVAKAAGTSIVGSSVHQIFSRLGARGGGTDAFLGVAFLIVAVVIAFEATSLLGAVRSEEAQGRIDHLLVGTVSRSWWLVGRLAIIVAALLSSGVAAGLFVWVGTVSQGSGVGLGTVLDAGINVVPPAVLVLGIGTLALGLRPRRATGVAYAVLGWSALIVLVGGLFTQSHWILDTSPFHQMAAAPAVAPDWRTDGALVGLGLLGMFVGEQSFERRDLQGE